MDEGFRQSYIVPVPKVKDCRIKSMTCNDFRGIAISPIVYSSTENGRNLRIIQLYQNKQHA